MLAQLSNWCLYVGSGNNAIECYTLCNLLPLTLKHYIQELGICASLPTKTVTRKEKEKKGKYK